MAALIAVALLPFLLTTLPLMSMMALKRGEPLRPRAWLADASWMAAVYLGSAFAAGLVHLNARRFGLAVAVVAAIVALSLVMLLRVSFARREAERAREDAKLAQARQEAEINQQRFTAAFTHAAIAMAIVRPCGTMLQVNQALCELTARRESELLGRPFSELLHAADAELFRRKADALIAQEDGAAFSMELRCRRRDGHELWVSLHCGEYEDPAGPGKSLIYQLHDISSRRLAESRLQHIAFHDSLTDLANRACFHERLEVAVERSRTDGGACFAVMFLDLDRFKVVNDSLGHIAGNQLLREVAQRLAACVRPNDLVARLGGDEFAILLDGLAATEDGLRLAERVLAALMRPVSINGTEVMPGASVGITFSDLGYRTVDEVLRDADLAMYEAKAAGRGRVARFDASMHRRVAEKLALEADLRHAIGEGRLALLFQPIYELSPYRLAGVEALARWTHPTRGPVSPAVFIALAEEAGHIEALTDWVLEQAVSQMAVWRRGGPGRADLGLQVNVSGRDLVRPDFVEQVQQCLQRHELAPHALTLEITETTLMSRIDLALQTLGRLRDLGVRIAIDDFGTGYSSLAYLSTLPIDSLKVDRSFVMGLDERPQNVEIVRAVLNLGRSLGRRVVAEGIETPGQLATLRRLGVAFGQGYLLAKPQRADQVDQLLQAPAVVPA
ncbi:MAG: EAL domain-containing protein [Rubrivivax sp.]